MMKELMKILIRKLKDFLNRINKKKTKNNKFFNSNIMLNTLINQILICNLNN